MRPSGSRPRHAYEHLTRDELEEAAVAAGIDPAYGREVDPLRYRTKHI